MRKSFTILILCLSPAAFAQAGLREAAMALDRAVTKLDLPVIEKLVPLIAAQEDRAAYQLLYSQGLRIGKMLLAAEKDEYQSHVTGLKGGKRQRFGKRYDTYGGKYAQKTGNTQRWKELDRRIEQVRQAFRLICTPLGETQPTAMLRQILLTVSRQGTDDNLLTHWRMCVIADFPHRLIEQTGAKGAREVLALHEQLTRRYERMDSDLRALPAGAVTVNSRMYRDCLATIELRALLDGIETSVGRLTSDKFRQPLIKHGLNHRSWPKRVLAARSLAGATTDAAVRPLVDRLAKEKNKTLQSVRVTVAILETLARSGQTGGGLAAIAKLLGSPVPLVRYKAAAALSAFKLEAAIPLLIESLSKNSRTLKCGRTAEEIGRALESLTEQKHGVDPKRWATWWQSTGKTFEIPKAKKGYATQLKQRPGTRGDNFFFGIPIRSSKVAFVVDGSLTMRFKVEYAIQNGTAQKLETQHESRWAIAVKQLKQAINRLHYPDAHTTGSGIGPRDYFNILIFDEMLKQWQPRLQPATRINRANGCNFLERNALKWGTNIYDAMLAPFSMTTKHRTYATANDAPDTMMFLTDGMPVTGKWVHPRFVVERILALNRDHGMRIHVVDLNEQSAGWLEQLARRTGGTYKSYK